MAEWSGDDASLLAGLVLLRVGDVRDRLALECVSRGWRAAVRAAGNNWQGGFENKNGGQGESLVPPYTRGSVSLSLSLSSLLRTSTSHFAPRKRRTESARVYAHSP